MSAITGEVRLSGAEAHGVVVAYAADMHLGRPFEKGSMICSRYASCASDVCFDRRTAQHRGWSMRKKFWRAVWAI